MKAAEEARVKAEPKIDSTRKELENLWNEFYKLKKTSSKAINPSTLDEKVQEWWCHLSRGIEGSGGWEIHWVSDDEKYIIVKKPGHSYWLSMLEPNSYAPTEHVLYRVTDLNKLSLGWSDAIIVKKINGRFSKAKLQEMIEAMEADRKNSTTKKGML